MYSFPTAAVQVTPTKWLNIAYEYMYYLSSSGLQSRQRADLHSSRKL